MKLRLVLLLTTALILGCAESPTAGLYEMWLPEVTGGDDGCAAKTLVEAAWWKADVSRDGDHPDWTFAPLAPAVEGLPPWHCPERGGDLECWGTPLGGTSESPATMVATMIADRSGDSLSGDVDVVSTPISGLDCTSSLTIEAKRVDWSSNDQPEPEASCQDLATAVTGTSTEVRRIYLINNSNTPIHVDWIDPTGGLYPMTDLQPYNIAWIDTWVSHVFRAQRQDDGTCLSMLQVGADSSRWILGDPP